MLVGTLTNILAKKFLKKDSLTTRHKGQKVVVMYIGTVSKATFVAHFSLFLQGHIACNPVQLKSQ